MAPTIVDTLFGVSPERLQQQRAAAADAQALEFAKLDPFQQANFTIGRGAFGLAGALGGALGGQDPELQRVTMRQQIAGQIDYTNEDSIRQGMAILSDDPAAVQQLAQILRQQQESGALVGQRSAAEKASLAQASKTQLSIDQETKLRDELSRLPPGTSEDDIRAVVVKYGAPDKMLTALTTAATQGEEQRAIQLVSQLKNADGTVNQTVLSELQTFPQGMAAIKSRADLLPSIRRLGAAGGAEVDPFATILNDATIPPNVQKLAQQYSKSFTSGVLDPEDANARFKELVDMAQRIQQFELNQQQMKDNQAILLSLRKQGLENSQQSLLIQQGTQALQAQNIQFQQDMKRQQEEAKEEERKNRPLPSYLAKEEEEDFSVAQASTNLATDTNKFINQIKSGDIKFGLKDLASIRARQFAGSKAPDVIARENYDKFLLILTNESLRLNKGTQTEGDAQRAAKELLSSESPEAAASAMNRLLEINVRRVKDASDSVVRRRSNAGFAPPKEPVQVPQFDVHVITPTEEKSFLANPKFPEGTVYINPQGIRTVKTLKR